MDEFEQWWTACGLNSAKALFDEDDWDYAAHIGWSKSIAHEAWDAARRVDQYDA